MPVRGAEPVAAWEAQYLQGIKAYDNLELEAAQAAFEAALKATPPAAEQAKILCYLGDIQFSLGDIQAAGKRFEAAVTADNKVELPALTSPKIKNYFTEIKNKTLAGIVPPDGKSQVVVEHLIPESVSAGSALGLGLSVKSSKAIGEVRVYYRAKGANSYSATPMQDKGEGKYAVAIPSLFSGSEEDARLEYYVEILDKPGKLIAGKGTATRPLVVPVVGDSNIVQPPPPPPPVKGRSFWSRVPKVCYYTEGAALLLALEAGINYQIQLSANNNSADPKYKLRVERYTNIPLYVAGGATVFSVVWYLTHQQPAKESSTPESFQSNFLIVPNANGVFAQYSLLF